MSAPESDSAALQIGGLTLMPGERVGPYIYDRVVGTGGMATVILARGPSDEKVALKILKASRFRTGLVRFRREFHALSRIKHPNVIGVDSYGDLHGHPYIVMEYVEGIDLHQTIRNFKYLEDPDERWRRCEELLLDICRALAHVHQRGLVHRDLKPSNILIDPSGHAKLTDFGIVKDLDPSSDANLSQTLVGTWAYASPEQISGEPIDQRSDLYSLGIILFAMLTGCRPFDEKDMKGYLEAHRNKKPPRPRQYDRRIPKHLDEICQRLLEKDPKDRFQSAREILYRLEQSEAETGAAAEEGLTLPLVGRGAEVEALQHAVDRLTRQEGGMVVVEGREGSGCSRLVRVVSDRAAGLGIPVHRLDAASGPAELFGLLPFCRQVMQQLGDRTPEPLTRAVAEWTQGSSRGGDAIHRLMDRLRPAVVQLLGDGPRVLLYDDFHQVPPRGLELVRTLIRTTVEVGEPVLAVFAVHTEALTPATEALLRGEDMGFAPLRLRLDDLGLAAVARLTEHLLGPGARALALARRLHDETQGSPLFIAQFLASLVQQGLLVETVDGLELSADTEEISTGHLEIPAGVRQVVRGRLGTLTAEERAVLEVLSVAGEALNLDLTLEVLEKDEEEVLNTLDRLIRRGIVQERRSGDLVHHEVTHRLMADVVYRELDTERRARLHRALAEQLERLFSAQPAAVEQIGDHYRLAGEADKAYRYLVQAARRMLARSLPGEAWDIALRAGTLEDLAAARLPAGDVEPLRIALQDVRGEVLSLRGAWQEALTATTAMLRAAERARDRDAEVMARCRLATLYRRTDQPERARQESNAALALARTLPRRKLVAQALYTHAQLAWEDGDLATVERDANEGLLLTLNEQSRVRGDMLLALSAVQATQGRMAQASKGMEEAVEIFARLGEKPQRCIALCNLSQMLAWQGRLGEARARADEAASLAHEIHYRSGLAFALTVRAEANLELQLLPQVQRDLNTALEECTALGLSGDLVNVRFNLARLALRQRDPRRAESHLAIARGLALKGDPEQHAAAITVMSALCCAMTEDGADAWRMLEAAEKGLDRLPVPRRTQVLLGASHAYASLGRRSDALRLAQQAAALARPRGLRLMDLEARLLLVHLAGDQPEAATWRHEAQDLSRVLEQDMGPDLAQAFRARPDLAALRQ